MFLESNYKNDDRIRLPAYPVNNPVQAKRSSGWKDILLPSPTPVGVELLRSSEGDRGFYTPCCASLARGYPYSRPAVLILKNGHAKYLLGTGYKSVKVEIE